MKNIKISVIIPCYNVDQYLEECLNSVIKQELNEIEILCIDDGSTDNTLQVLKQYASKYNKIKIFQQTNSGPGVARNYGLKMARGEFVAFLDADDFYYDSDALSVLYQGAKENDVLISGGTNIGLRNGETTDVEMIDGVSMRGCFVNKIVNYIDFQSIGGYWRYIYNRQMLLDNNIVFPSYRRFQDPPFFLRAMHIAKQFYAADKIIMVYRRAIKPYKHNLQIAMDCAKGSLDMLEYAGANNLKVAFLFTIEILQSTFEAFIAKNLVQDKGELKEVCNRINDCLKTYSDLNEQNYCLNISKLEVIMNESIRRQRELLQQIKQYDTICIYGAGAFARTLYSYFNNVNVQNLEAFIISNKVAKDAAIDGIPVINIEDMCINKENVLVIIATQNKFHAEIYRILEDRGYENIISIDQKDILLYS